MLQSPFPYGRDLYIAPTTLYNLLELSKYWVPKKKKAGRKYQDDPISFQFPAWI